jgi:imidazolonepropionase-like amidohydrolase
MTHGNGQHHVFPKSLLFCQAAIVKIRGLSNMRGFHLVLNKFVLGSLIIPLLSCGSKSPPKPPPGQPPGQLQDTAASQSPQLSIAPYQPDSGNLLVHCGSLIDGRSDTPQNGVSVLITDGYFSKIASANDITADVPVLDLSGYTCFPGLIEMHTHILESYEELVDLTKYFDYSIDDNMVAGRNYARISLNAGFTSARTLGNYYQFVDRELRDEIDRGEAAGPRLQVAGFYLTIPGGGGDLLAPDINEESIPDHLRAGVSRSPEEFRAHALKAVEGGADVLKIIASGAVLAYGGVPGEPEMTREEIQAAVEIAHAAGLKVAAHAHGAQSIKDSILAGADTIEHATYIDDEGIRLASLHDVALVMDIGAGDWMIEHGRQQGWVEEFLRKTIETTQVQRENFKRAHDGGASIVFGTDAGIYPHGLNGMQFAYMVEYGMTPMEAIQAATSRAAFYMGWGNRVGAVETGMLADFVAVKGNPLEDITLLENVDVVVKGGLVFKAPTDLIAVLD